MDRPDDTRLIEDALAGDFNAFDALVTRHEQAVYTSAYRVLRNRHDAEDAVQTAFLNALEHLDRFRGEASFATWVRRIAVNASLKILRRKRTRGEFSLDAATAETEEGMVPHPKFIADWGKDPAADLESSELGTLLEQAIDELGEKHRLVFLLRDVEGLSVAETAQELGISEANVKVRLLRARLALRETLSRAFGDETRRLQRAGHTEGEGTSANAILQSYLTQ
jgi:RNA polymerase sigma-70 factor, ECF subfamily